MKWVLCLCCFLLVGCKHLENKNYERNGPPRTSPPLLKGRTEVPPLPPNIPHTKALRAFSVPSDRWIVARWDPDLSEPLTYRIEVLAKDSDQIIMTYTTSATKVDLVEVLKQQNVMPGWYRVGVKAVNGLYLPSDPSPVCYLFWYPSQDF